MKKLALSAILGASLMVTSSAFALTSMSDSNMKAATGQAGVSIAIDNVVIEQFTGSTTYTDSDGVMGQTDEAGSIVITDKHVVKSFKALVSNDDFEKDFATAANFRILNPTAANFGALDQTKVLGTWNKAAALTIDVGTCTVLTAGVNENLNLLNDTSAITVAVAGQGQAVLDAALDLKAAKAADPTGATYLQTLIGAKVAYDNAKAAAIAAIVNTTVAGKSIVNDAADASIYLKAAISPLVAADEDTMPTAANLDLADTDEAFTKVVGVVIGLPTLCIATSSDSYSVGVSMTGAINDGQDFIKITKGASAMAILSGTVEIAAH